MILHQTQRSVKGTGTRYAFINIGHGDWELINASANIHTDYATTAGISYRVMTSEGYEYHYLVTGHAKYHDPLNLQKKVYLSGPAQVYSTLQHTEDIYHTLALLWRSVVL